MIILNDYYRSLHESYGDEAIGYVCLKRNELTKTCILKCKVCPEHRIYNKGYSITLIINEENEKVLDVECHVRSEHPSITEVECYWHRSTLASICTSKRYLELNELRRTNMAGPSLPDNSSFRQNLLKIAEQMHLHNQLSRHNFILKNHKLMYLITASRIHEAVYCKTLDGSFVQQIINFAGHHEELISVQAQGMARETNGEPKSILDTRSSAAEDWPSESTETSQDRTTTFERATEGGPKEIRKIRGAARLPTGLRRIRVCAKRAVNPLIDRDNT
ncbi:hypothetical protein ALC56_09906 [Trachymyrmex septentrionalis]|uniref:Uncharacterized protein n=1 Tax=Trachymyrmex septentrionalis TaxID=34720 RepID=A0A151JUF1_9HYME|nr:hypothetical protein ALC56_09906 [Trachymyrmex septentrionalis]